MSSRTGSLCDCSDAPQTVSATLTNTTLKPLFSEPSLIRRQARLEGRAATRKKPIKKVAPGGILGRSQGENLAAAKTLKWVMSEEGEPGTASGAEKEDPPQVRLDSGPQDNDIEYLFEGAVKQRLLHIAFNGNHLDHSKYRRELFDGGWRDQTELWKVTNTHRPSLQRAPLVMDRSTLKSIMVLDTDDVQLEALFPSRLTEPDLRLLRSLDVTDSPAKGATPQISSNMTEHQAPTTDPFDMPRLSNSKPLADEELLSQTWKTWLHLFSPELHPIIKWDYEWSRAGEVYHAQLTVILPPSHPVFRYHPLLCTLPDNPFSPEYIRVVNSLGGVRSWIGWPGSTKAEAKKSALTKFMSDGGADWLDNPILRKVPTYLGEAVVEPAVTDVGNEQERHTLHVAQYFEAALGSVTGGVFDLAIFGTRLVGAILTIGVGSTRRIYQSPPIYASQEAAADAACRIAIRLNALGFIDWLKRQRIEGEAGGHQ